MAITSTIGLKFKEQEFNAGHNFTTATLIVCLMDTTFSFQPATHNYYSDVSADEIATGNGYTQDTKTLANVVVSSNATTNLATVDADDVSWTATGGTIATSGSLIIYNSSNASNTVVMCIDYGADYATTNGNTFTIDFSNGVLEK